MREPRETPCPAGRDLNPGLSGRVLLGLHAVRLFYNYPSFNSSEIC